MKVIGKKKLLIACAGSVAAVSLATTAALSAGAAETDRGVRGAVAVGATPGERLLAIADKVGPAVPVPAGKVVRLDEQSRALGTPEGKPGYQAGRSVTWAPADQTKVWRQFRQTWTSDDPRPSGELLKARCGDYYEPKEKVCKLPGDWQKPTPAWLAGLPRDADAMRKRLEQDRSDNGRGDAQSIREITDLFGNPAIPNDVRATIFRAVAQFPGLRAVEAKDLAGRRGIAFGVASDVKWIEFIVDPATGEYLGDRDVLVRDLPEDGPKAGDVLTLSSQRESIVDKVGRRP